jgi:Rod binding domain-containing protein
MPISPINTQSKVNPADIPLEKLSTSKALTEEQKTSEMTRQFEAVLLRQILNEAHKTTFKSKFATSGVSGSIYQDMMVNQMADKISSARTVGLAQELEAQVSRQANPKAPKAAAGHATQAAHDLPKKQHHVGPPIPLTKAPRL